MLLKVMTRPAVAMISDRSGPLSLRNSSEGKRELWTEQSEDDVSFHGCCWQNRRFVTTCCNNWALSIHFLWSTTVVMAAIPAHSAPPSSNYRPLADKVAVVTGSSRGIGAAIAKKLAADGAIVAVNYFKVRGQQTCFLWCWTTVVVIWTHLW